MVEFSIANRRYGYLHECKWPSEAVDTHHVFVRRSSVKGFFVAIFSFILFANASYLFLVQDKSIVTFAWSFLLTAILVKLMLQKLVVKESVVVFPSFGVQLETHYLNGRIIHRFVPIDKILKPVLLECVTPVTCYWSLSLILRGEPELMLVFKELHPPMKMLIPIWKTLCFASESKDDSETFVEEDCQRGH